MHQRSYSLIIPAIDLWARGLLLKPLGLPGFGVVTPRKSLIFFILLEKNMLYRICPQTYCKDTTYSCCFAVNGRVRATAKEEFFR